MSCRLALLFVAVFCLAVVGADRRYLEDDDERLRWRHVDRVGRCTQVNDPNEATCNCRIRRKHDVDQCIDDAIRIKVQRLNCSADDHCIGPSSDGTCVMRPAEVEDEHEDNDLPPKPRAPPAGGFDMRGTCQTNCDARKLFNACRVVPVGATVPWPRRLLVKCASSRCSHPMETVTVDGFTYDIQQCQGDMDGSEWLDECGVTEQYEPSPWRNKALRFGVCERTVAGEATTQCTCIIRANNRDVDQCIADVLRNPLKKESCNEDYECGDPEVEVVQCGHISRLSEEGRSATTIPKAKGFCRGSCDYRKAMAACDIASGDGVPVWPFRLNSRCQCQRTGSQEVTIYGHTYTIKLCEQDEEPEPEVGVSGTWDDGCRLTVPSSDPPPSEQSDGTA